MKTSPKNIVTVVILVLIVIFGGSFLATTREAARNNGEAKPAAECFKGNAWSSVGFTKAGLPGSAIDTHETEAFYHSINSDTDTQRVMSSLISCLASQGYSIAVQPIPANMGTYLKAAGSTKNSAISILVEPYGKTSQVSMSFNFK